MKFTIYEDKLFHEVGIDYMVPPVHEDNLKRGKWVLVFYNWHHIPTGERGKHSIYVHNENDIDELLTHWNRLRDWEYYRGDTFLSQFKHMKGE